MLPHRPDAIDEWACSLRQRFQSRPVAVCLELRKGPIVYALQKYEFLILFPVNPVTLAKYREAFTPSHAKDDPTDAEYQLELLVKHRDKLKALRPQSAPMRTLESLVEQRRCLVDDGKHITNRDQRIEAVLPASCPMVPESLADRLAAIKSATSLTDDIAVIRATLEGFFREHHVRSTKLVEELRACFTCLKGSRRRVAEQRGVHAAPTPGSSPR